MRELTEQEKFWQGEFGDHYIDRNVPKDWVVPNILFFAPIVHKTGHLKSVLELGANIGLNLMALRTLLPDAAFTGIEINQKAARALSKNCPETTVKNISLLDFEPTQTWELVFTKGVLIHLAPEVLAKVYQTMYKASKKYIFVAEYYNPTPVEISYRGHERKLFKRDFAGELMQAFPDLKLVDYGFVYHKDPGYSHQDDLTWFLLEKSQ